MIRGESGQKIPASFRSGRFEARKKSNKMTRGILCVGQPEKSDVAMPHAGAHGKRFKHACHSAPKQPDKNQKIESAKKLRIGPCRDGPGRSEIKKVGEMGKERQAKLKRRDRVGF